MTASIPSETDPEAPRATVPAPPTPPRWIGALSGVLAAAVATTLGTLVAASLAVVGPLDAVGSSFIDRTPLWLKQLAVDWFGTNDKLALRIGTVVVIALVASAAGMASLRRRWVGTAAFIAFGVVGLLGSAERPGEPAAALIPVLAAIAAGVATLWLLLSSSTGLWRESLIPGYSAPHEGWERRRFLGAAGSAVAIAVATGAAARALERQRLQAIGSAAPDTLPPVANGTSPAHVGGLDDVPGITPLTTPNEDFYRIDTALRLPTVAIDEWTVRIHGMVEREISLTYKEILTQPMVERMITLCCVSNEVGGNLIGNAVWQGVLLRPLLEQTGVQPGAQQVFTESIDGFTSGFPVAAALDGRDCIIAIGMNDEPLPLAHGFPARLVVPGLYGYVSATKWLKRIELTTWDAADGYWIPRGWARQGPVKTQSRIDAPRRGQQVPQGQVAVAGVAWAQHRGVTKVEVRIDTGAWHEARLADDAGIDVWRQWVYEWDARPGDHTLQVRATDGTGYTQTQEVAPVAPNGATGYHTRNVTVIT